MVCPCVDAGGGACTTDSNWSQFSYAPDKHRYYQAALIAGVSETTVYVGGYEAWTRAGVTTFRHHLMAYGREVAEVDLTNSGSSVVEKVSYVLTDHLGSVDDVQGSTSVARPLEVPGGGGGRKPGSTNVGLIHMNGQVYDPLIG